MPRALQRLGCGMGAVPCDTSHHHIAQPSIERGGFSEYHSVADSALVTNTSCECPVCGRLMLHVGAIIPGRPSDPRRGPPCDATAAPLTHSGCVPSCLALRIRRYG